MRFQAALAACLVVGWGLIAGLESAHASERPNVLMIAIDDLNDWLGCLHGHPQAKTPHIDQLAKRGVLFTNAHCAAPLCNPSRAAVFSGYQPFATGVFANNEVSIRQARPDLKLIPTYFKEHGYDTYGAGKLLHQNAKELFDEAYTPEQRWSPFTREQVQYTQEELPSKGSSDPRHRTMLGNQQVILPLNRMPSDRNPDTREGESFDWGPLDVEDNAMGDGLIADWAVERLQAAHPRPFFVGVGFYRPHIPLFAPKKYFDRFDLSQLELPPSREDDLDDLEPMARELALAADTAGSHASVVRHGQWKNAVHAYLACVAFVDDQIGKIIESLDASPHADNTLIILWGDHGWHLGEKQHWGKWTGWQRSTRVPLIVIPPRKRMAEFQVGAKCHQPTSLLDVYPTLIELSGLTPRSDLAGVSLLPAMRQPEAANARTVITTFDKGNYSVMGHRWHLIHYADGSEELYDLEKDPNEWENLIRLPELKKIRDELARSLPDERDYPAPAAGGSGAPGSNLHKARKQRPSPKG